MIYDNYNVFLMIELARLKGFIDRKLEYDLMWEQGGDLYTKFEISKFNVGKKTTYDCILDFLNDYKNKIVVRATITAYDKNSNNAHLRSIYAKSKEDFNKQVADFMDEIPYYKYYTEITTGIETLTPEQEEMVSDHEIQ